jgi:hypothetical protein
MYTYETIEHAGCEIRIESDDDPLNPRVDYDNAGTMVCFHSSYNLGDEQSNDFPTYQCLLLDLAIEYMPESFENDSQLWDYARDNSLEAVLSLELIERLHEKVDQHYITLPLYLYDHSGITMRTSSFSCPWDSGQVGIIYISKKQAVEEWGRKYFTKQVRERAEKYLEGEVETYDQYLTGDVFGFIVEHEESGEEDSCWGFYGSEYCIEEAKQVAECLDRDYQESVRQAERDRQHRLCVMIRNHVPLEYRSAL